jgi:LCP family protein required for cell wall assembly
MPDETIPTQPHNEPVNPANPSGLPHPAAPGRPPHVGHWYSLPPTQSLAQPHHDAAVPSPLTARGQDRRRSARDRVRRRKVRREIGAPDDWAWVIIASALLGMTIVMSMSVFFFLRATRSTGATMATSAPAIEPTSVIYGPGGILEGEGDGSIAGLLGNGESMVIQRGNINERFTILLLGMDQRPGEFGTAYRTDTMILISLDPKTNRVGMLSIPRDLFVDIPGYGLQRVNTAYGLGELSGPGGGPQLAMQTIQYNFGIRVNEYVVVNFESFIKVIDLIGGVNVYVETAIYDPEYPDMNYGYDPFYIEAGWHQMDGATALKYARSRHSTDDIDRGRRQQQVLYAIRDKVTAMDMIPKLAPQAYSLWAELNAGVDTGLSLDQILQLAWWVKDIPSSNYTNAVLGWDYVTPTRWEGMDILVPTRSKMGPLMVEVFGADYGQ